MSHEVETMAWTNEVPWHGLGVKVAANLTVPQMMKEAGLDWKVEKAQLLTPSKKGPPIALENFFALKRSTDERILDVVGKQWEPIQNEDAFKIFNDLLKTQKMNLETMGSLKHGRMVWGLANIKQSFKLKGGDEVKGYLLVSNPHEQGKSHQMRWTSVRVVCNNTLTMAMQGASSSNIFRLAHRGKYEADEIVAMAKATLGIADEMFDAFEANASKLAAKKVNKSTQVQFLRQVFDDNKELQNATIETILEKGNKPFQAAIQALSHSPGHDLISARNTAWGLLNSVTYVTDHMLGRTSDARLSKAWFGKNETIKQQALKLALEL